jgi:hypothetical protein
MELLSLRFTISAGALVLIACGSSASNTSPFAATNNTKGDASIGNSSGGSGSGGGNGSSSGSDNQNNPQSCSQDSDCNGGCNGAGVCCCDPSALTCFSPSSGQCGNGGGEAGASGEDGGDDGGGGSQGDDSGDNSMPPI